MEAQKQTHWVIFSFIAFLVICIGIAILSITSMNKSDTATKLYEEITTSNKGVYIVKNVVYKGVSLDFVVLGKVIKQIRSECSKPCKINLYSNRQAYDLDIMAGETNFKGYSDEQRNYLATHILAFWGIEKGDNIEFYPNK